MNSDRANYLIIGNSTAAIGAIEGIRRVDREAEVLLVSKEPYHCYCRPLISYLLAGQVDEDAMYYRPRDFYRRTGVDARLGVEVARIDPRAHVVETVGGSQIRFERLLVATGGRPSIPPVEGANVGGVFTFTSWDDAKAIEGYMTKEHARAALVLGAGLIGIKAAEALRARGLDVVVVELADRVLPLLLDAEGSSLAAAALQGAGVEVRCGTTLTRVLVENGRVSGALLGGEHRTCCDLVIIAVGVVPEIGLVGESEVATDRGILIDTRCQTSGADVFAAGDVTQGVDTLTGESRPIATFTNAYRQGIVAGVNMAGGDARVDAAFAMNSVEVCGLPAVSVGLATAEGDGYRVLARSDREAWTHKRVVLKDGRVVGALSMGRIERAGILTGLIRERVGVSGLEDLLLGEEFGLLSLPAQYRKHVVSGEGVEV